MAVLRQNSELGFSRRHVFGIRDVCRVHGWKGSMVDGTVTVYGSMGGGRWRELGFDKGNPITKAAVAPKNPSSTRTQAMI